MLDPVLVVGEVVALARDVADALSRAGHAAVLVPHVHCSVAVARAVAPSAVIVCLPLPDASGRRVVRVLRRYGAGTPVLAVARQLDGPDRERLLAAGAEAVLSLPSDARALLERLGSLAQQRHRARPWSADVAPAPRGTSGAGVADETVPPDAARDAGATRGAMSTAGTAGTVRRPMLHRRATSEEELRLGDLVIRPAARLVRQAGRPVPLTPKEFDVLLCLARQAGQAVARATLLEEVWGSRGYAGDRIIDSQIFTLRRKLEGDARRPRLIRTVAKYGYRLDVEPSAGELKRRMELAG